MSTEIITDNKNLLKGKHIFNITVLTRHQIVNLNELKLATRKKNGKENLVIKYIKGISKIITENSIK